MAEIEIWDERGKRTLSDAEYIEEFGRDAWEALSTPVKPESEMTEEERSLARRMQAEGEANAALAAAGISDLDELPHESDEDVLPLGDLENVEPREYDDEGALRDLEAREAGEQ